MNCCVECFNDLFIKKEIIENDKIGNCDYCESEGVFITDVYNLNDLFSKLLEHYHPTEPYEDYHPLIHDAGDFGDRLIELINEDWNIFSENIEGLGTDENLLSDILDTYSNDPLDYIDTDTTLYSRITESLTFVHPLEDWEKGWENFKYEIKHKFRFFPQSQNNVFNESFNEILAYRKMFIEEGLTLFRARLGVQPKEKMLAPPNDLAKAGRANPNGISYLYCGMDKETCVAEIRPWKNAEVTIATLRVKKELCLIDLRRQISPFLFNSPYKILEVDKLLKYFSFELSTPVDPTKSEIEYIPTQYITELIKSKGFDGIYFKSAMGSGDNLVIFDQSSIEVEAVSKVRVLNVQYQIR
jgi:RES domain/HEPN/RES N-terminal domain 1